jgi:heme-degrading monooxygenase HmoA
MAVQVISKRKFQINEINKTTPLLKELQILAKAQPGYISRESLRSLDNPGDYLVVSRWNTASDWQRWLKSQKRRDIQGKVDSLIGEKTFYEVFEPLPL